ncbi:hypothetical protein SNOG_06649 [Parastagonospora nodorum SN15]|uniref:Uncharacterized protein n=1 Tax=Phaeosphaeria nodorum (strain SN15 / ATCC MYA-4574 / FGSC 10173) TaxID=321614 RepID=Q0UNL5_PHANO|nr:hypothetical protein SNOG_06649 [Parastagonospora nodorum SN15]EAT86480.1 hypothetical protein SNOG_06649 [Parastagonospora nodorum SN15]
MKRVKIGRRRGRQEQMMPTLISTELHVAAGGLSYVGSTEFEMATKTEMSVVAERSTPVHATREQRFMFMYTWYCNQEQTPGATR